MPSRLVQCICTTAESFGEFFNNFLGGSNSNAQQDELHPGGLQNDGGLYETTLFCFCQSW